MRKLKIYLDTSVISHLDAPETPERMFETELFWKSVKSGVFEIVISDVVLDEINACPEPKRSFMRLKISEIPNLIKAPDNNNTETLAKKYIEIGGLPKGSFSDALHLAVASIECCDCVASWNLKHMVNIRAIQAVKQVNTENGYGEMGIYTPASLAEYKEVDDE